MLPHFFALRFYQYFQATANPPPLPPTIKSNWQGTLDKGGIHIPGQHSQT